MVIEVYSVKNVSGSALKAKLEEALRVLQLPYAVRENHNIEDFIEMGLTSIPAVKVGHTILPLHDDQPFESTIEQVVEAIESNKNRYILVPIDFSQESLETLQYAMLLAEEDSQDLLIAHIHEPIYDPVTGNSFDQHMLEASHQRLEELVNTLSAQLVERSSGIAVRSYFAVGDKLNRLARLADAEQCALIIMNTHSASSWMRKIFGTVPLAISKKVNVPLLAVPPGVAYQVPEKVIVAVPPDGLRRDELEYCIDLVEEHQIFLDFIYVTDEAAACKTIREDLLKDEVLQRLSRADYAFHQVRTGGDAAEVAISDYATFTRANWIMLFGRNHNLGVSLFHHSIRKHSVLNPTVPVMLMPIRKNDVGH
jgi:nucleotide-binding universal stress UspA family protein